MIVQARKEKKDKMDGKDPGGAPQAERKKQKVNFNFDLEEAKKDAKK